MPLTKPSPELARRLTQPVNLEQAIYGVKMHRMVGSMRSFIFNLQGAVNLLEGKDELGGDSGWITYIDPETVKQWLRETMGDEELAKVIEETVPRLSAGDISQRYEERLAQMEPLRRLLKERLTQCQEVTKELEAKEEANG